MTELGMTDNRRETLTRVRDDRVRYVKSSAAWVVDDKPVSGWSGRTLAELRRTGYIEVCPPEEAASDELSTVVLTERGATALDATE